MGGSFCGPPVRYHYFHCFLTYSVRRSACARLVRRARCSRAKGVPWPVRLARGWSFAAAVASVRSSPDPIRGHCQAGSLTGAVHLSNNNAGVLRPAQRGQKPRVEQKGKSWLDPDFQYEYGLRKHGLSILLASRVSSKRCQKSYHRDNWLVAAKRS